MVISAHSDKLTNQPFAIGKITLTAQFLNPGANWDIHAKFQPSRYRNGNQPETNQSTNQPLFIGGIILNTHFPNRGPFGTSIPNFSQIC